jgi:hypothetical protein
MGFIEVSTLREHHLSNFCLKFFAGLPDISDTAIRPRANSSGNPFLLRYPGSGRKL